MLPTPVSVLVVDDDEVDVELLRRAMRKRGLEHVVEFASDGEKALDRLTSADSEIPQIVLMDLRMPKIGGLELLRTLRADPKLSHLIVFVLTTSADPRDTAEAYAHQVAGYFTKESVGSDFAPLLDLIEIYQDYARLPTDRY